MTASVDDFVFIWWVTLRKFKSVISNALWSRTTGLTEKGYCCTAETPGCIFTSFQLLSTLFYHITRGPMTAAPVLTKVEVTKQNNHVYMQKNIHCVCAQRCFCKQPSRSPFSFATPQLKKDMDHDVLHLLEP